PGHFWSMFYFSFKIRLQGDIPDLGFVSKRGPERCVRASGSVWPCVRRWPPARRQRQLQRGPPRRAGPWRGSARHEAGGEGDRQEEFCRLPGQARDAPLAQRRGDDAHGAQPSRHRAVLRLLRDAAAPVRRHGARGGRELAELHRRGRCLRGDSGASCLRAAGGGDLLPSLEEHSSPRSADLKPDNILVTSRDRATLDLKIADFGLARMNMRTRDCRTFCGTPYYYAPELIYTFRASSENAEAPGQVGTAEAGYGKQVDMWGMGVILYILLSGAPPFEEEGLYDQICQGMYEFDAEQWAEVSLAARLLVQQLMTVDPKDRLDVQQTLQHAWLRHDGAPPPAGAPLGHAHSAPPPGAGHAPTAAGVPPTAPPGAPAAASPAAAAPPKRAAPAPAAGAEAGGAPAGAPTPAKARAEASPEAKRRRCGGGAAPVAERPVQEARAES
ncbi:unnamed protein product, partial [Prorocentrum cordatum]